MAQRVVVSLLDWLRTGTFGPLRFGQTRAQIRAQLGQPDDLGGSSRKYRRPSIWKYGDFEFYFLPGEDALIGIHTDTFVTPRGGAHLQIDPWVLRRGMPLPQGEQLLAGEGLAYRAVMPSGMAATPQLAIASGIRLSFTVEPDDSDGIPKLYALSQSVNGHTA